MYSPDTIKGVLSFCAREGQPTSALKNYLYNIAKSAQSSNCAECKCSADRLLKELEYDKIY